MFFPSHHAEVWYWTGCGVEPRMAKNVPVDIVISV